MTKVIIFKQDTGIPAVIFPSPEILLARSIYEIAVKDVPTGKAFAILEEADLPVDIPQEAWIVPDSMLSDGVGGNSNEFTGAES